MPLDEFGNEIIVIEQLGTDRREYIATTNTTRRTEQAIGRLVNDMERNVPAVATMPITIPAIPVPEPMPYFTGNGIAGIAQQVAEAFNTGVRGTSSIPTHGLEYGVPKDHPLTFLDGIAKELGITRFTFATYGYQHINGFDNTYADPTPEIRTVINGVPTNGALIESFLDYIAPLHLVQNGREVAVQSKVMVENDAYHMPMIDFSCKDINLIRQALDYSSDLTGMDSGDFELYSSGTSFHAYGRFLIPEHDWLDFTSTLLLISHPKSKKRIVDSRWVGHSQLKRGFSLRLTKVGKPQLPTKITT
jgi:hypothetical protein